jgi:hypothetical protein
MEEPEYPAETGADRAGSCTEETIRRGCPPVFARAAPNWANIAAARIGAEAESPDIGTGGPDRFSFGRSEFDTIRTASASRTSATRSP